MAITNYEKAFVPIDEMWTMVSKYIDYLQLYNQSDKVAEMADSVELFR